MLLSASGPAVMTALGKTKPEVGDKAVHARPFGIKVIFQDARSSTASGQRLQRPFTRGHRAPRHAMASLNAQHSSLQALLQAGTVAHGDFVLDSSAPLLAPHGQLEQQTKGQDSQRVPTLEWLCGRTEGLGSLSAWALTGLSQLTHDSLDSLLAGTGVTEHRLDVGLRDDMLVDANNVAEATTTSETSAAGIFVPAGATVRDQAVAFLIKDGLGVRVYSAALMKLLQEKAEQVKRLEASNHDLAAAKERADAEADEWKSGYHAAQKLMLLQGKGLEETEAALSECQDKLTATHKALQAFRDKAANFEQCFETLAEDKRRAEFAGGLWEADFKAAKASLDARTHELDAAQADLAIRSKELAEALAAKAALEQQLARAHEEQSTMRDNLKMWRDHGRTLEAGVAQLKQDHHLLGLEVDELYEERHGLCTELYSSQAEVASLSAQLQAATEHNLQQGQLLLAMTGHAVSLEVECATHQVNITALNDALVISQTELAITEQALMDTCTQAIVAGTMYAALEQQVLAAAPDVEVMLEELRVLRGEARAENDLLEVNGQMTEELQELKAEVASVSQKLQAAVKHNIQQEELLQAEISNLQQCLAVAEVMAGLLGCPAAVGPRGWSMEHGGGVSPGSLGSAALVFASLQ